MNKNEKSIYEKNLYKGNFLNFFFGVNKKGMPTKMENFIIKEKIKGLNFHVSEKYNWGSTIKQNKIEI